MKTLLIILIVFSSCSSANKHQIAYKKDLRKCERQERKRELLNQEAKKNESPIEWDKVRLWLHIMAVSLTTTFVHFLKGTNP